MPVRENHISVEKSNGRIYTPGFIVKNILDLSGYRGKKILKKHAIDNSCGDGAFLVEMISRYCKSAIASGLTRDDIARRLEEYIHGIEIDANECEKCRKNASAAAKKYGVEGVMWDIRCADAMTVREYDGRMDFVLGNPPYVRVHNAGDSFDMLKQFSFARSGMTDFYIAFYEIGLRMLKKDGVLGYITPSSFFGSLAGEAMRRRLVEKNLIEKIVDLKHYQAFETTTYTTMVVLKNSNRSETVAFYRFDADKKRPVYVDSLAPVDYYIDGKFYFSSKRALRMIRNIFYNTERSAVSVKNGYATLCDEIFVGDFDFESRYIIPVVKASTGKTSKIIYPYGRDAKLVSENELKKEQKLYDYLVSNRRRLDARSSEDRSGERWYAFGRSQALGDTYKNKLAFNALLRTAGDLKPVSAPAGTGVYGGLYLVGEEGEINSAKAALASPDFTEYISLLGKYKSGGYYTYSSKDVKAYLDYKFACERGTFDMTVNDDFLRVVRDSFRTYLRVGTSRSTAKLKTLHGHIAADIAERFGKGFTVRSQGVGDGREADISGRYYKKKADITVEKDGKTVAGYAVKFVMRNYSQNSNNYFENMLGETANIRSNGVPYFQIFIIFDKVPYYKKGGEFMRYDVVTPHNLDKYLALSKDDPREFRHTPDKTLVVLIKLKEKSPDHRFKNDKDYAEYYKSVIDDADLMTYADRPNDDPFSDGVIYNDYEDFIDRSYHVTLGGLKNK